MTYKVGAPFTGSRQPNDPNQYAVGQRITVVDDSNVRIAVIEVLEIDEAEIRGKVINTYGHKRTRRNQKP